MPRHARKQSETGIYHIILRGVNKQVIFEEGEDKARFMETLKRYKPVSKFELYAYCLLDNHVHLLLKEIDEQVSTIIKRISCSYVYWFNNKYGRCGHLFQERFKSEPVNSKAYFFTLIRYIHQNPIKAGLAKSVSDYRWSSYREYLHNAELVDIDIALDSISAKRQEAINSFQSFNREQNEDSCMDYEEKGRVPDSQIRAILQQHGISTPQLLNQLDKQVRNRILRDLKNIEGVSVRQLARITGISKSVVSDI